MKRLITGVSRVARLLYQVEVILREWTCCIDEVLCGRMSEHEAVRVGAINRRLMEAFPRDCYAERNIGTSTKLADLLHSPRTM